MSSIEKLPRARPYPTLRIESDAPGNVHWIYMHADNGMGVRPCFRTELMSDMWNYLSTITVEERHRAQRLRHVVLASDASAFNLGGDLALFSQLIRDKDRDRLLDYARRCVEGVHHFHTGLGGDVRTIALVQGDALGGGMELALSCHTIVAEEGVDMGLPEVLFGLFPGMGAYSFLCKRVSPQLAERMILGGQIYSSEELHRMGVVDVLVPRGQGEAAVQDLVRQQQRAPHAHIALNAVRAISQPVSFDELMGITEVWVDTALSLGDKSLRTMDRIVKAQARRSGLGAG
jgi:DSF synthase